MDEASPPVGVLLGASNLRRGLTQAVGEARKRLGPEAPLLLALGHGRSYALTSSFLVRSMPGILQCGLWPRLEAGLARRPVRVLITDVGNDLVYGATEDRIAGWVGECLERLPNDARVTLALPPIESLARLGRRRFELFLRVFFPGRPHDYDELLARAQGLHRLLSGLASEPGDGRRLRIVEPSLDWYGFDPIHIRSRRRGAAWAELLADWGEPESAVSPMSLGERGRLLLARPERAKLLGLEVGRPQPALKLGTTEIGLY